MLRLTGGRNTLTSLVTGLPTVTLTTMGARTGRRRTVVLVGMSVNSDVVLIASNWGQNHHPAWYHNLCANPHALLSIDGGLPRPYIAREAVGAERRQFWDMALDVYPGYERYACRAAPRQIPVLVLSPA